MLPALIAAGASLAGGLIARRASQKSQNVNYDAQKEFAQHGISWKVADAKKAGIHPLYAMGASTHSFSPMAVGDSLGPALANAGQDISRAMYQNADAETRQNTKAQALQLENMGLQNDLLRAQIAKLQGGQVSPASPNPVLGDYSVEPARVTAANPSHPELIAGPPEPGWRQARLGSDQVIDVLSPQVSEALDDMELLKYGLMIRQNWPRIIDYASREGEPLWRAIHGYQQDAESITKALRDWAAGVRGRVYNARTRSFNQKRGSWGREAR